MISISEFSFTIYKSCFKDPHFNNFRFLRFAYLKELFLYILYDFHSHPESIDYSEEKTSARIYMPVFQFGYIRLRAIDHFSQF